jgi:hypothetical protein
MYTNKDYKFIKIYANLFINVIKPIAKKKKCKLENLKLNMEWYIFLTKILQYEILSFTQVKNWIKKVEYDEFDNISYNHKEYIDAIKSLEILRRRLLG